MSLLGSVGQLYMLILLTLLFLGFGLAIWSAIRHFAEPPSKKENVGKANSNGNTTNNQTQSKKQILGGIIMANNGWLKLAIFSFVGILISFVALGVLTTNGMTGGMASNNMTMTGTSMANGNSHLQHQQQAMDPYAINNMQMAGMQGNMNMNNMQMANMQMTGMQAGMNMQGNMNSMPMYGMQSGMNVPMAGMQMNQMPIYGMQNGMNSMPMNNMNMGSNDMMMMLQNMQMQMNQMQQQVNMMNNGGSMSSGSMSNSSMGGSSGGGMGMMGGMM
ncbi:MAG TPA: hypothetical protein VEG39_20230 [Clostridia bacterium]|nr:hypothetical protein [Clostridia bacterium]